LAVGRWVMLTNAERNLFHLFEKNVRGLEVLRGQGIGIGKKGVVVKEGNAAAGNLSHRHNSAWEGCGHRRCAKLTKDASRARVPSVQILQFRVYSRCAAGLKENTDYGFPVRKDSRETGGCCWFCV